MASFIISIDPARLTWTRACDSDATTGQKINQRNLICAPSNKMHRGKNTQHKFHVCPQMRMHHVVGDVASPWSQPLGPADALALRQQWPVRRQKNQTQRPRRRQKSQTPRQQKSQTRSPRSNTEAASGSLRNFSSSRVCRRHVATSASAGPARPPRDSSAFPWQCCHESHPWVGRRRCPTPRWHTLPSIGNTGSARGVLRASAASWYTSCSLEGRFVGVLFRKGDWKGFASEMPFRAQIPWFKLTCWSDILFLGISGI